MKLIHKINKPLNFVFSYLTNMQKFASVHPVITKITSLSSEEHLAYETLQMGLIAISFRYRIFISKNIIDKTVKMKANVMRLTTIEIDFKLQFENGFTEVEETVHFKTILPVKGKMENIFRKHHARIFQNIGEID